MNINVWVVGHTPVQLDLLTAGLRAYNIISRVPARVLLLRNTEDDWRMRFRGARSGIIVRSPSCANWKVPQPYDRPEFLYLTMDL